MSLWRCQRPRVAALALVAAAVSWWTGPFMPAPHAAAAAGTAHPSLTLVDQSEWVSPTTGASAASFELDLRVAGAPSNADVTVTFYSRLQTRTGFESALRSGPSSYELGQVTEPLSSLPPDPRAPGSVGLAVTVTTSQVTTTGRAVDLDCASPTATGFCTGVYPVEVTLKGAASTPHFTTFLTYTVKSVPKPLDVAWVVPISAPVHVRSHPSGAAGAVAPVSAAEATAIDGLVSDLRANPKVPVTIEASPQTLESVATSGSQGRAAVTALAAMSADPSIDEVLNEPYVPIDLGALDADQGTEVNAQMSAGQAVLQRHGIQTSALSTWVVAPRTSAGTDLAAGLSRIGATRLVVPDADLVATSRSAITWASTFDLKTTTAVTAAASDGELTSQFTARRNDPALAASQLLADLAMVHFERPNTRNVRGLVAVPPSNWTPNATFDRVLLAGLSGNPVVSPVTLDGYFTSVSSGGSRTLKRSGSGSTLSESASRSLSSARTTLTDFESAVVGSPPPPIVSQLSELLLASEDATFKPAQRSAALGTFRRMLDLQYRQVQFAKGTVTLTARTGWIPITVLSSAPYMVTGTLSVTGDQKFEFPHGSAQRLTLVHSTNPTRIDVRARSSGDLALTAKFVTPVGDRVIASSTLTVRSTATSLVGIVLTALALAVLAAWWVRTWWSARRRRRQTAAHRAVTS